MTASIPSKLDQPKVNILAIVLSSVLLWGIYINGDMLQNAGMGAAIILNWVPLIIGVFTMALYGLSRLMTTKRNWMLTAFGIGFNIFYVIMAFL